MIKKVEDRSVTCVVTLQLMQKGESTHPLLRCSLAWKFGLKREKDAVEAPYNIVGYSYTCVVVIVSIVSWLLAQ